MSAVPKFPRTFHLPFSPEIHGDDKTHTAPEVFVGREIVVSEKIDGGNTCLHNGNVFARSTGQPAAHPTFNYIKARHAPKTVGYPGIFFYGENLYGIHSIEYTNLADFFYLFAIRSDLWESWDNVLAMANGWEFRIVPTVFRGSFESLHAMQRFMDNEIKKPSALGGPREGFVIRVTDQFATEDYSRYAAKYVRSGHIQTDEHWTKNWQAAKLGDQAHGR